MCKILNVSVFGFEVKYHPEILRMRFTHCYVDGNQQHHNSMRLEIGPMFDSAEKLQSSKKFPVVIPVIKQLIQQFLITQKIHSLAFKPLNCTTIRYIHAAMQLSK